MMETLRQSLLPKRLTQIYTDTKKSYEHVVRTNQRRSNSQSATTDRKLRIQKDRLIAWGLEWADSRAGDIDASLDRAGISDLVESIMTSINELLDEADQLQQPAALMLPGSFPDEKQILKAGKDTDQSGKDLARLEDIVRDITTSIDTLCDLSRSQQGLNQQHVTPNPGLIGIHADAHMKHSIGSSKETFFAPESINAPSYSETERMPATYIDFNLLRIPQNTTAGSSPPSYETVAASSDDRVSAFLSDNCSEIPVVLEYTPIADSSTGTDSLARRFQQLVQSLQAASVSTGSPTAYIGAMDLLGWFQDPHQSRYGLVYKMPDIESHSKSQYHSGASSAQDCQSESLLSFLQHGADTDTLNMPSLEDRFRLAYNLATSLLHFHENGTTHRNINSNNIMFFYSKSAAAGSKDPRPWTEGVIRHPFLASFDQCDEDVHDTGDEPFISSIYRHPRTARGQRRAFKSAFDLYSLGIVLVEIALWMPINRLWKTRYSRSDFKVRLQSVYIKKLAAKCSTTYMRVVESCLKAADENPRERNRQRNPRVDLYWNVVKPLEKCCFLDHVEGTTDDPNFGFPKARKLSDHKSSNYEEPSLTPIQSSDSVASRKSESFDRPAEPLFEGHSERPQNKSQDSLVHQQEAPSTKASKKKACKCQVWSHEVPAACSAYWNATMAPKLDRILQKAIDRWESYSIDLFMSGETPEAARPTIYMMCASTDKARKVLQFLNKDKNFFDIKVVKGQITRSKAGKRRRPGKKGKKPSPTQIGGSNEMCYRRYQQRPACGASIGAYLDNHHLPPVSFGGTVLVNGESYGMSVHHMLENDEVDMGLDQTLDLNRSMAPNSNFVEDDDSSSAHSSYPQDLPEALYPFEIENDEDEGYQSDGDDDAWLSEIIESESFDHDESDDENMDMGDTDGIEPGSGEGLIVTQPAIDDVDEGFFPNEDDMDDEHLSSHTLGYIHASSGIKRSRRGAISHEIDWALIKMKSQRRQTRNLISGGARHCDHPLPAHLLEIDQNASFPSDVVKTEDLGGLDVHALGRTSGLQAGRILPAMSMIKMPGRISASHSWTVMGNFGGNHLSLPGLVDLS